MGLLRAVETMDLLRAVEIMGLLRGVETMGLIRVVGTLGLLRAVRSVGQTWANSRPHYGGKWARVEIVRSWADKSEAKRS